MLISKGAWEGTKLESLHDNTYDSCSMLHGSSNKTILTFVFIQNLVARADLLSRASVEGRTPVTGLMKIKMKVHRDLS